MYFELTGLLIAAMTLVVAVCAWLYPKLSKSIPQRTLGAKTKKNSQPKPTGYRQQIEIATVHLEASIHDGERTSYIESLARRLDAIQLVDLLKLISFLIHDINRLKSVKAFSGKVDQAYTSADYKALLGEFIHSKNKQKVAKYLNHQ